ncbi:MAG: hypothetical protein ACI8S6_005313 [Myxococcota bacterium]|jgi:uncharacterized protein YjbI with pentapeptide repeats
MDNEEQTWTPGEILNRYRLGERDFTGLEISEDDGGSSFAGSSLDGADFSDAFIVAGFDGTSLRGARFIGANIKTCSFIGADIRQADFAGAGLDGTTFQASRLEDANFEGATIQSRVFSPGEVPDW